MKKKTLLLIIMIIISIFSLIFVYNDDFLYKEKIIKIMFSAIGCISVIPITAYITSNTLIKNKKQTEEIA